MGWPEWISDGSPLGVGLAHLAVTSPHHLSLRSPCWLARLVFPHPHPHCHSQLSSHDRQTWLFLPRTLCIYSYFISSGWFQPSVASHLDLNFAWCPEPMALSTDVILAFPWCSSTSALAVIRGKWCPLKHFTYLPPLPAPRPHKFLPWLKHRYWVTLNFCFTVIPQITFVVTVLTSMICHESSPCILISSVYMYSPLLALPLVRREVADRSCILTLSLQGRKEAWRSFPEPCRGQVSWQVESSQSLEIFKQLSNDLGML